MAIEIEEAKDVTSKVALGHVRIASSDKQYVDSKSDKDRRDASMRIGAWGRKSRRRVEDGKRTGRKTEKEVGR